MLSRRSLLIVTAVLALVAVPSASGVEIDGYTATGDPSHVKPSTQTTFTITLTNKELSPKEAERAKIGIPADFVVDANSVQASASAAGACVASTWIADGTLIADGKMNLKRPGGGGSNTRLCPGATLTVVFSASASAAEGTYVWATELLRGEEDIFLLSGPQPSVHVDGTPPTVTINSQPANPSSDPSPTFTFSASEQSTFECKLDDKVEVCTSPKTYNLPDGIHTFEVKATDAAGNTGSPASHEWLIETDLPVVTLTGTPSPSSKSSAATFLFTANTAATFECKLNGAASFEACASPRTYTGLADGPHTFRVKATGTAGTGPETVYAWTIDTVGPTSAISEKPADPTNSRSATFAFAASEPATFQCKLDDGAFASCASPQTYGNVADGAHTFVVRATDAVGNSGPETAFGWTIETRAPALAITSAPPGLVNTRTASFSFSTDEPSAFQCSLDGRPFEPCSAPASYGGLADGGHAFAVRATDAAGNVAGASHAWTIDATPPQTTLGSRPRATTAARLATFRFSANEAGRFVCRLDNGSFSPCRSPKTYSRLKDGVHRFVVRAIDAAGNADATPAASRWRIGRAVTRTAAASALFAPTSGARVTRAPLLRWRAVKRATYYNVQLYRAGRKVLTAWPTRTRLQLRMRWRFNGRAERLKPGVYRWYVWPGFGRPVELRYGRLLGTSTFTVGRAALRR